jgi:fibronectin type 3 domain-containing protein
MNFFHPKTFIVILVVIVFSSFRHSSSLIGSEEREAHQVLRVGLIDDTGDLATSIPEAVTLDSTKLPPRHDLSSQLPQSYPQGDLASSVGFALGYVIKSYTENRKLANPKSLSKLAVSNPDNQAVFYSPTYIYNATNLGKDQGGSVLQGLILLSSHGILNWNDLPYNVNDYRDRSYLGNAKSLKQRIAGFQRIPTNNLNQIKAYLLEGHPLPTSILFFKGYSEYGSSDIIKKPSGAFMGAQAVVLAGYDDSKKAFKFLNSWGPGWGDNGYGWIDYTYFQRTSQSVYYIDDPPQIPSPMDLSKSYPKGILASQGNYKDRIRISWSSVRGAIGYEIYRKRSDGEKFSLVGLSIDRNFEDFGIQKDLAYHYSIASVFPDDSSSPSPGYAEGYASNKPILVSHQKITGLVASQGRFSDRVIVQWNPIPSIKEYHIYKYNRYSKGFRFLAKTSKPEYIDQKVQRNGDLEFYRVSVAGKLASSVLSDSTIGYATSRSMTLPPPSEVEVSKGEHSDRITLQWEEIKGAVDYKVYRFPLGENTWEALATTTNNIYEDISPDSPKNYYSISSLNKLGIWSKGSEPVLGSLSLSKNRSNTLLPPKGLETKVISKESESKPVVRISWMPVKDSVAYMVYFRKIGGDWSQLGETTANYFQHKTPKEGSFYLYSVASVNELKLEGRKSQEIPFGLMRPVLDDVKFRSFGADSNLEKFKGLWTGMYWDGKANVTQVTLDIGSKDETNQSCKIQFNNRLIYEGDYIQELKISDPKGGFQIEIGDTGDALHMNIHDKKIFKENTSLSFIRE